MELIMMLTADYANVALGDKLNVMGIFRTIGSFNFPAKHAKMHLVVKLGADLGEYGQERLMTILLNEPDGKEMLRFPMKIKVPEMKGGQRPEINAIIEMQDIIFPHPGRYQFVLLIDKDHKGSFPIDVVKIEPPNLPTKEG